MAVNSAQVQGLYGPQYRTPATFSWFLAGYIAGQTLQASHPQNYMCMQVMSLQAASVAGFSIFRVYPLMGDPGGYILSFRPALASSRRLEGTAGAVAAITTCTTILKPPSGGYAHVEPGQNDVGTSSRCKAGN